MAIVTLSPLVSEIKGSVKSLTFKRHGKGAVVTGRPSIPYTNTQLQKNVRERWQFLQQYWKAMPDWVRVAYDASLYKYWSRRVAYFSIMTHTQSGAPNNLQVTPVNKSVHGSLTNFNMSSPVAGELHFTWKPWDYDGDKYLCLATYASKIVSFSSTPEPELMSTGAYILSGLPSGITYRVYGWGYSVSQDAHSQSRWKQSTVS